MKENEKDSCRKGARLADAAAAGGGGLAVLVGVTERAPGLAQILAVEAAMDKIFKVIFDHCADDPPDPRYKRIAPARPQRVGKIPNGLPAPARRAINLYVETLAAAAAHVDAHVTAIERAQGAVAARDKRWARNQTLAAARNARRAADALRRIPPSAQSVRDASGNALTITVSLEAATEARAVVANGILPADVSAVLRAGGLSTAEISSITISVAASDPSKFVGTFTPGHFVRGQFTTVMRELAKELDAYAKRVDRAPLTRPRPPLAARPRRRRRARGR